MFEIVAHFLHQVNVPNLLAYKFGRQDSAEAGSITPDTPATMQNAGDEAQWRTSKGKAEEPCRDRCMEVEGRNDASQ